MADMDIKDVLETLNESVFPKCQNFKDKLAVHEAIIQLKSLLACAHGQCNVCKHYTDRHGVGKCKYCCYEHYLFRSDDEINDNWEWRGF